MNVKESMQAVQNGTFEAKINELSTARAKAAESKAKSSVQRGREMYTSLHSKED